MNVTECLILAAGKGSRISEKGQPKPLIRLLGLALIERVITSVYSCGIQEFTVVTGYRGKEVRRFLDELGKRRDLVIKHVINDEWDKENGLSVLKAKDAIDAPFLLVMSDHVIQETAIEKMVSSNIAGDQVLMCVDYRISSNSNVRLCEATKVYVKGDVVTSIGKHLDRFNALDTGLFVCTPIIFDAIEERLRQGDSTLSGAIRTLSSQGKVKAVDIGDAYWYDIDDEASYKRAKDGLLSSLGKSADGPISKYINRPISIRITERMVNTRVSPNAVSMVSFLFAIVGAICFLFPGYLPLLLGAILSYSSSILDGCDGEVARLKYLQTDLGAWLDAVLDRYADALLILGLSIHSMAKGQVLLVVLVGYLALAGSLINSYTADKYDRFMEKRLQGKVAPFRIGRDLRIMLISAGALLNIPVIALALIAIVMNIENIRRVILLYTHQP